MGKELKNNQENQKKHFDNLSEKIGEVWWGSETPAGIERLKRRAKILIKIIQTLKPQKILEVGCGTGALTKHFIGESQNSHITAFDISPKCIDLAKKRYYNYDNVAFEIGDLTNMKYKKESFDMVIGNSILHHIDLEQSLKEIYRVLKPDGYLVFFEPNRFNLYVFPVTTFKFLARLVKNTEEETAFFRWILKKNLEKNKFREILITNFDFIFPLMPERSLGFFKNLEKILEKTQLLKETSGSLIIRARK